MYLKRTQKSFVVHEYGTGAVQGFCLLFLIPLYLIIGASNKMMSAISAQRPRSRDRILHVKPNTMITGLKKVLDCPFHARVSLRPPHVFIVTKPTPGLELRDGAARPVGQQIVKGDRWAGSVSSIGPVGERKTRILKNSGGQRVIGSSSANRPSSALAQLWR